MTAAIRELRPDELEAHLLPLAEFIAKATPYPVPTDAAGTVRRWKALADLGIARTWALPGVAVGCTVTEGFYTGLPTGVVTFWWAAPEARGRGAAMRVFTHAAQALRDAGVRILYSSAHADHEQERVSRLHRQMGFEPCEIAFRKLL